MLNTNTCLHSLQIYKMQFTVLLSTLACTASANILFWQADYRSIIPPRGETVNHITITGISGETACDAYGNGGTQATGSSQYNWITDDNYCGRTWKVRGAEFWVVRTSDYAQTCSPAAIQQKLPYALMFDMGGAYQGWCQGMGNGYTSDHCTAANAVLNRDFKFMCYTNWFLKRDGVDMRSRSLSVCLILSP